MKKYIELENFNIFVYNTNKDGMRGYNKIGFLIVFLLFFSFNVKSQSDNYWSVNLNSEAALLGGAVVGGGSGITSIYYNPAGISEIEKSSVSLNSSMFSLVSKTFKDALGTEQDISQLDFEMSPRFLSYLFRSKKIIELTWELAVFNRDNKNVFLRGSYDNYAENYGFSDEYKYSGVYDLWERYNDYYVGLGTAYEFNDKFIMGASMFVSMKSFTGINEQNTSIKNQILTPDGIAPSSWYSYKMLSLFDVRIVPKLGFKYLITKEISLGITFNFPSFDVLNYASATRILSYTNIVNKNGDQVPDYFKQEVVEYVNGVFKDPFSIAVGVRRQPSGSKNIYSMTVEWFSRINPYKAVDAESGKSMFGEEKYGTEFSNYYMGNRSVLNFAFGYKREVRENLELLFGFKSDFFSYQIPGDFFEKHKNANTLIEVGVDMIHFSAGANFIFKKKFKINMGGSLSYGRSINNQQFMNFVDANWYDYETGRALQGIPKNEMTYRYIVLGLFLGFSLDF